MKYPDYVNKAIELISAAGHEAFVVGGALRDAMLGRDSHDFDLATSALPEETAEIFRDYHVIKTGLKHGTVTAVIDRKRLEITTYRVDGDYKDSRHPDGVSFTRSLEEDLSRRDFTVNAMAYNRERGVVDLFGGQADLEAGIIRAVGEAKRRFDEDALRIMRAFRFVSKLGFDIEETTLEAARDCRHGLLNISMERKSAELEGVLCGAYAKKALELMKVSCVAEMVMPCAKLDEQRLVGLEKLPVSFACRMAFCHVFAEGAEEYIGSLRLSNAVSGKMRKFISLCEAPLDTATDGNLRRLMARAGDELGELLIMKSLLGEKTDGIAQRAEEIRARGDCISPRDLKVDGRDLSLLGISGKAVGEVLDGLFEVVLDDPEKNERKILLKEAERLFSGRKEDI